MDTEELKFQYANECDLEIHCSPFGLSGLYIKVKGSNIMGIGSTMGLITGSTKGLIHYNDCQDLIDQKYKLYVVVDDEGMLRIDFTKIFTLPKRYNSKDGGNNQDREGSFKGDHNTSISMSPTATSGDNSYPSSLKSPLDNSNSSEGKSGLDEDQSHQNEVPALIFRGKCPDGRPDKVEPFIGIFSFERED